MTRKEICENTCCFGGLIGASIVFITTFIYMGDETWFVKITLSLTMSAIGACVIGAALGGIVFILTLPFYRSIPWDIKGPLEAEIIANNQEIFKPIDNRWQILDIRE